MIDFEGDASWNCWNSLLVEEAAVDIHTLGEEGSTLAADNRAADIPWVGLAFVEGDCYHHNYWTYFGKYWLHWHLRYPLSAQMAYLNVSEFH